MSVAHGIYEVIKRHSPTHVYCVPGESYLALLNEFSNADGPLLINTRHEEGAGLMAEAHAKLTGETGTVLVTRGPGLTHLTIALHTARQDSTPLVAFVGQVPTAVKEREAFQEVDIPAFCAPISKWTVEIPDASRAVDIVEEAYRVAASGRPGPVVISLPEDIDRQQIMAGDGWSWGDIVKDVSTPTPNEATVDLLAQAKRPVIIAGRPVQGRAGVREGIAGLAETLRAPVYNAWRRFDAFDNEHPHFAGNLPIVSKESARLLRSADVFVLVDDRLDEFTSLQYSFPTAQQRVLLLGGEEGGFSSTEDWERYLAELAAQLDLRGGERSKESCSAAVSEHRRYTDISRLYSAALDTAHPAGLVKAFAENLPENAVVTSDAGTFASWIYRETSFSANMRFLGPTAGGMGYALPAAIGARIASPGTPVFAVAGDGGFAMTMSELQSASQFGVTGIGMFVFDNEIYGTIAAHQDRHFPNRRVGIELGAIDYAAVAASFGWEFAQITSAEQMASVVKDISVRDARVLVHVPIPKEELNPLGFQWPLVADLDPAGFEWPASDEHAEDPSEDPAAVVLGKAVQQ